MAASCASSEQKSNRATRIVLARGCPGRTYEGCGMLQSLLEVLTELPGFHRILLQPRSSTRKERVARQRAFQPRQMGFSRLAFTILSAVAEAGRGQIRKLIADEVREQNTCSNCPPVWNRLSGSPSRRRSDPENKIGFPGAPRERGRQCFRRERASDHRSARVSDNAAHAGILSDSTSARGTTL